MSMVDSLIEGVTKGLVAKMGVDPQKIVAGFNQMLADAGKVKNEVLAAKQGFIATATAFKTQLDRIEAQNRAIMAHFNIEVHDDDQRPQIEHRREDAA